MVSLYSCGRGTVHDELGHISRNCVRGVTLTRRKGNTSGFSFRLTRVDMHSRVESAVAYVHISLALCKVLSQRNYLVNSMYVRRLDPL